MNQQNAAPAAPQQPPPADAAAAPADPAAPAAGAEAAAPAADANQGIWQRFRIGSIVKVALIMILLEVIIKFIITVL